MTYRMGADAGTSNTKFCTGEHTEEAFPSAVMQLSEDQFTDIMSTPGAEEHKWVFTDEDDGTHWLFGEVANEQIPLDHRPKGIERWTEQWTLRLVQGAMVRSWGRGSGTIELCMTYPPQDRDRRTILEELMRGTHTLTYGTRRVTNTYHVTDVKLLSEPVAAILSHTLNYNGTPKIDLRGSDMDAVWDGGGFTSDFGLLRFLRPVVTSYGSNDDYGIEEVARDCQDAIWYKHRDKFGRHRPMLSRVHESLRTGIYSGGGGIGELSVKAICKPFIDKYKANVVNLYGINRFSEAASLFLVGGGTFLAYDALKNRHSGLVPLGLRFENGDGFTPEKERGKVIGDDSIYLAARGAYASLNMLEYAELLRAKNSR